MELRVRRPPVRDGAGGGVARPATGLATGELGKRDRHWIARTSRRSSKTCFELQKYVCPRQDSNLRHRLSELSCSHRLQHVPLVVEGQHDSSTSGIGRISRIRIVFQSYPVNRRQLTQAAHVLAAQPAYLRERWRSADHVVTDRRHLTPGMQAHTTSGLEYPSKATAEKGHGVLDHLG